jgi:hypothetical protein
MGKKSPFLFLSMMRIRVFASGPLSFKAAMPSESKVIYALSLHNKSLPIRPTG